jgi:hypothetical protein
MEKVRVVSIEEEGVTFDDGTTLGSFHPQDCCESHYLSFNDLTIEDFEGLEFDLSDDKFFNRIEDYGIELVPLKGYTVKVPGYGSNNGYYSSHLDLVLTDGKDFNKTFDITECQDYDPY